jgi:hypothetical protein
LSLVWCHEQFMEVLPGLTLQWIFFLWAAVRGGGRLGFRLAVVEAICDIARCRTGGLGWRIYTCPEHGDEPVPNSCGRRDCPGCVGRRAFLWSAAMENLVLAGPNFHVVFTLSDVLNPYWRHNREAMADILFKAAAASLLGLLASPEHMGGTPTIIAVLHTHGGALVLHPHIHIIVSMAGLSPKGTLVWAKRDTLLPYRALRRAFQMAFLDGLRRLARKPEFYLPKDTCGKDFQLLLTELYAQPQSAWNVRVFRRNDVRRVIRYLSRTVYGGPLRNDRIVSVNRDGVVFRYQDWRQKEEGGASAPLTVCRLSLETFVARWSEHVHEPGMHSVRHFGLLAPGKRDALDLARAFLLQSPLPPERKVDDPPEPEPIVRCKHCQRPMTSRTMPPTQLVFSPRALILLRARASPFSRWEAPS